MRQLFVRRLGSEGDIADYIKVLLDLSELREHLRRRYEFLFSFNKVFMCLLGDVLGNRHLIRKPKPLLIAQQHLEQGVPEHLEVVPARAGLSQVHFDWSEVQRALEGLIHLREMLTLGILVWCYCSEVGQVDLSLSDHEVVRLDVSVQMV